MCWLLLWAGINTGPGNLDLDLMEKSAANLFNGLRAAFPIVVLLVWPVRVLLRKQPIIRRFTWPEALWLYYGLICIVASIYAGPWFDFAYWGFAYLSAFAATEMYMEASSTPDRAASLNRLNWIFGVVVLATVVWVARDQLLDETSTGMSGYGVSNRLPTVAGIPMVRASGVSRLAAIPAIVSFVFLLNRQGVSRLLWICCFVPTAYLVWVMQSRGSLVSFAVALIFVTILMESKRRYVSLLAALVVLIVYVGGFIPEQAIHTLWLHATRGTRGQQLVSMSGRTSIFDDAWRLVNEAPLIGYGPQADRRVLTIVPNAQNAILYALLCSGFIGGAGFVGGLLISWVLLARALSCQHRMTRSERTTLLQVAGVLAFMTMRSFPENCGALFSVDLLFQLPVMVYLGESERAYRRRVEAQARRIALNRTGQYPHGSLNFSD